MLNYVKSFEEEEKERLEELTARACKKEQLLRTAINSLVGNNVPEHDRFNTVCELVKLRGEACSDIRRYEKHLTAIARSRKGTLEVIDDE